MSILAGLFLVAHGLVHLAVWVAPPPPDVPFDSRRSWLLGDVRSLVRTLAIAACAVFVLAGVLVIAAADVGATLALVGAAISLALVLLTFNRWFVFAVAINAAIIAIALG